MASTLSDTRHNRWKQITLAFLLVASISVGATVWLGLTRLPPNTYLDNVPVGTLTPSAALETYRRSTTPLPSEIVLSVATRSAALRTDELQAHRLPERALDDFAASATNDVQRIMTFLKGLRGETRLNVPVEYDLAKVEAAIASLSAAHDAPGEFPSITLVASGKESSLVVNPGKRGTSVDATASADLFRQRLHDGSKSVELIVQETGVVLNEQQSEQLRAEAAKLVGKSIVMTAERIELRLSDQKMIQLLDANARFDQQKLAAIAHDWQQRVGTQPVEPVLDYDPATLRVHTFEPPRNGRTINQEETARTLAAALSELIGQPEVKIIEKELPLVETPPQNLLGSLNDLGIKERIGFGESKYAHSIPNRVHNVAITTERINNVIVPPGAEFSFNKTLGDVSAASGYRTAYVIRNGKTELGDGGGVCQVSTTLFRSVVNAGLEITKRLPHSYRVSYYELDSKPGFDATVYAGEVDFRFKNDTPGHLLVHAVADSKNTYMYVEIYGTSDGRRTKIIEHKVWDARPAPPPQYFPDPSLPPGKLVQIDWSAGGIRSSITNVVYNADGSERRRDTFVSNYRPWAAKYLQGVAPQ